jgi:Fis family transcriptional regulator, factor for inversion stimulation protein
MFVTYDLHPNLAATHQLVGLQAADVERELILATLGMTHGNRTHAAAILGISIRTLRNKLHEYVDDGIEVPQPA